MGEGSTAVLSGAAAGAAPARDDVAGRVPAGRGAVAAYGRAAAQGEAGQRGAVPESDLDALCRREHPRLVASLTAYTGDHDLAVELSQEALARACLHWPQVREMAAPGAWLHRVAVNLANSTLRRRRYERAALARAAARASADVPPPPPPYSEGVRQALKGLPRRQREAVVLRYVLDLDVAQTAEHMGCAAGTVRALTAQGIAALRRHPELSHLEEHADD